VEAELDQLALVILGEGVLVGGWNTSRQEPLL
jgi:hypothetical protein